jgi:hypothetical protein
MPHSGHLGDGVDASVSRYPQLWQTPFFRAIRRRWGATTATLTSLVVPQRIAPTSGAFSAAPLQMGLQAIPDENVGPSVDRGSPSYSRIVQYASEKYSRLGPSQCFSPAGCGGSWPRGVVFIGDYALVRRSRNAGRSNTCWMSGALQKLSGLPGHHAGARWPK